MCEYINATGLENLKSAVVERAARDYRLALEKGDRDGEYNRKELEEFFTSKYFNHFTKLDGHALLEQLKNETPEERHKQLYARCKKEDLDD